MKRSRNSMIRAAAALAVVLSFSSISACRQEESPPPRLHLEAAQVDLGQVFRGQDVRHVFQLENRGGRELEVRIRSSCGCVRKSDTSLRIPPDERRGVEIAFGTDQSVGDERKTAILETNDPLLPNETLEVSCFVKVHLRASPARVDFGEQLKGGEAAMRLRVLSEREQTKVLSAETTVPGVTVATTSATRICSTCSPDSLERSG